MLASRTVPSKPRFPSRSQPPTAAPAAAPSVFAAYSRLTTGAASPTLRTTPRESRGNDSPISVVGTTSSTKWNANAAGSD